ncbi:hypothetical protein QE152_g24696 [Popillia japonica]|uniref:Uncharacterized protein n=1 Tax=Popillia japonica TaxID=7064 RepID=A0AAW1K421_POPJA
MTRRRANKDLAIPSHGTTLYERRPYYAAVKAFNALPGCLKHSRCTVNVNVKLKEFLIKAFNALPGCLKHSRCTVNVNVKLKEFLIDKSFYSFDEFLND